MVSTFQVYLTDREGKQWFEPLLADDPAELVSKLRKRIIRQELKEVRVEQQGRHLFTLER
jgi:hypothetical protein